MAKQAQEILSAIRLKGKSYGPGQEEELEEILTPEQVKDLKDRGALKGPWKGKAKAASEPEAPPAPPAGGGQTPPPPPPPAE